MSTVEFAEAARVATNPLAGIERRCLIWMAGRLPRWITSDGLTALALAAMALTGVSYALSPRYPGALLLAVVGLGLNWGVGPTELRLVLAAGTLALLSDPKVQVLGEPFRLFDVGGAVATVGILVTLLVSVARNVRILYHAEPLP